MTTNFDRAASFYDDTRSLPEAAMAALTDRLADGLGRAEQVLEIGVGTGRVAVPLSERGYAMTGIDISEKMLAILEAKSSSLEVQVADATDLPFGDASFDAVLAVDFFHLVAAWRRVVEEAVRVLRPRGRIVLSAFAVLDDPTTTLRQRMFEKAGTKPRRAGIDITDVMAGIEGRFGAATMELAAVPHIMTTSLAAELNDLREGTWSRYWDLPDDLRWRVADRIEGELLAASTDLAQPLDIQISLKVLLATLPG